MSPKSQTKPRARHIYLLWAVVLVSIMPPLSEAVILGWGIAKGFGGKALRDGVDFWAGGFLALHGEVALLFDPVAYDSFLHGIFGKLPTHVWSYPPNYLLMVCSFSNFTPWHAILLFDAFSLLLLVLVLRLAQQSWWLIGAVMLSPPALENLLTGQNAALITALIGGGLLLLPARPRLGGLLVGLASVKPQLGLVLPLYLARRAPISVMYALLAAIALAAGSLEAFGPLPWVKFWQVTRPVMDGVLLTGQPSDFATGLSSVFAAVRPWGVEPAIIVQGMVSLTAVVTAVFCRKPASVLILAALASPYVHSYDLLGVGLAVALLVQERLATGFVFGEKALLAAVWIAPGLILWIGPLAHLMPVMLLLLLAISLRRGPVALCDSSPAQPGSPVLSAGRSPIPAPPGSMAPGSPATE